MRDFEAIRRDLRFTFSEKLYAFISANFPVRAKGVNLVSDLSCCVLGGRLDSR